MIVYQVLLIYQYLSLPGYQVLLQQSEVSEFLEMFLTHDPTQPNPAQPNPTRGSTQPMDNSGTCWAGFDFLDQHETAAFRQALVTLGTTGMVSDNSWVQL